jgi:hypothetical protein
VRAVRGRRVCRRPGTTGPGRRRGRVRLVGRLGRRVRQLFRVNLAGRRRGRVAARRVGLGRLGRRRSRVSRVGPGRRLGRARLGRRRGRRVRRGFRGRLHGPVRLLLRVLLGLGRLRRPLRGRAGPGRVGHRRRVGVRGVLRLLVARLVVRRGRRGRPVSHARRRVLRRRALGLPGWVDRLRRPARLGRAAGLVRRRGSPGRVGRPRARRRRVRRGRAAGVRLGLLQGPRLLVRRGKVVGRVALLREARRPGRLDRAVGRVVRVRLGLLRVPRLLVRRGKVVGRVVRLRLGLLRSPVPPARRGRAVAGRVVPAVCRRDLRLDRVVVVARRRVVLVRRVVVGRGPVGGQGSVSRLGLAATTTVGRRRTVGLADTGLVVRGLAGTGPVVLRAVSQVVLEAALRRVVNPAGGLLAMARRRGRTRVLVVRRRGRVRPARRVVARRRVRT